ncbi:EamA family transporter [Brenneria roseae subsp. americana]|uniref:EamA family transporter n=1 Tax=Brenneria roseae subsp. americana TaxID=1508507 RepID=A0A2U1TVZ4_9GAMM|nr:DMT family transporter [Brenneria roseae]PWC13581.1 EamA family transporter [Brenneria roseae subsp. americana]
MLSQQRRADLLLVATTLIASFGWIFSKESLRGMPTFGFIGLRFLLAGIFLLPFCFQRQNHLPLSSIPGIIGVGCLQALSILLWIYAVSLSNALGEGAFIMSLSMLFVPLVAWAMFRQSPSRPFWESLPLAMIGLALLTLTQGWQVSVSQCWFLGAALAQAVYFCVNSRYARTIPVLPLTCIQLFCTGTCGLIISGGYEIWPATIDGNIWLWFVSSAILATSIRFLLQIAGQKRTSVANAAIIMVLEPVWTVLLSALWYGEKMPAQKALGCILILFALVLYRGRQYLLLKKLKT